MAAVPDNSLCGKGARTCFKGTLMLPLLLLLIVSASETGAKSKANNSLISRGFSKDLEDNGDFCKQSDPDYSLDCYDGESRSVSSGFQSLNTFHSYCGSSSMSILDCYLICRVHFPCCFERRSSVFTAQQESSLSSRNILSKFGSNPQTKEYQSNRMLDQNSDESLGEVSQIEDEPRLSRLQTHEHYSQNEPCIGNADSGNIHDVIGEGDDCDDVRDDVKVDEDFITDDDVSAMREVISYRNSVPLPDYQQAIYLDLHLYLDAHVEFHELPDATTATQSSELVVEITDIVYRKDNPVVPEYTVNTWIASLGSPTAIVLQVGTPDQSFDHFGPNGSWVCILMAMLSSIVGLLVLAAWIKTTESTRKSQVSTADLRKPNTCAFTGGPANDSKTDQQQVTTICTCSRESDIDLTPGNKKTQNQSDPLEHNVQHRDYRDRTKEGMTDNSSKAAFKNGEIQNLTHAGKHVSVEKNSHHGEDENTNRNVISTSMAGEEEELLRQQPSCTFGEGEYPRERQSTMKITDQIHHRKAQSNLHKDFDDLMGHDEVNMTSTPRSNNLLSLKWPKPRLRLAAFLSFSFIIFVTVAVGVSRVKHKPTIHIMFPANSNQRNVRMFSDFPDLSSLSKNHTSLSLVSRLQLLDAQRCRDEPESCKISVVCDRATGQDVNCRCRTGFYFSDWKCRACSSHCPTGHYLASPCSSNHNAVCKACTICGKSQYVAAPCNTKRDTVCIDVSFPAGFLPMNRSNLPDDKLQIYVSHSSNVFVERLIDQHELENAMYITNNQQVMEFVWDRLSSVSISISVSGVFLVPEYRDVSAVDDTKLFNQWERHTQTAKNRYAYVQQNYCRHPVPDYYALHLEMAPNRTGSASVFRCDSKNSNTPPCPAHMKDGDRYVDWDINTPCSRYKTKKVAPLNDGPNSVVCNDETPMLRDIFKTLRPATQEFMFPSVECMQKRTQCSDCLKRATCSSPNAAGGMFRDEQTCCGIACFTSDACKMAYSPQCPKPEVECALGDVNIFSLFPDFSSMEHQFSCHLRYHPPKYLYKITYVIHIPSLNYNSTGTSYVVGLNSRKQHQKKITRFDFLYIVHDTGMPIEEEILLNGDHQELYPYRRSHMKPYTIRRFKTHEELSRLQDYQLDPTGKISYVQFERPFQYSSYSWYKDGCYKNMSRIFPNQTLYSDGFLPIEAKMAPRSDYNSSRVYQMYRRNKQPNVKLFINQGQSILQFLQGRDVKGNLIANSLHGQVTWHFETETWRIVLTGQQDKCPSVVGIKIFTQLMTGCAGHFDAFIDCPAQFTITFNFSTFPSDLPDIFVLQINDSVTSHRMVLSSMYAPLSVEESRSEGSHMTREEKQTSADIHHEQNFSSIWQPLLVIVSIALALLLIMVIAYHCVNIKARRGDLSASAMENEMEKVALNNHSEKQNHTPVVSVEKPKTKWFVYVFVLLYVLYCLLFSFSLTAGVIYLSYSSSVAEYSQPKHSVSELEIQVNKSVQEIKKFETSERLRLFAAFEDRRQACMDHLEEENKKLLQDYQETTQKQIADVFTENGTLHRLTNQIQRQNVSMYMFQISEFLSDCNKTVHSIIDRFESNYFLFLKTSVNNGWLDVPRQIFLVQDGDPDQKHLSHTQIKQFASWLEIDKVRALLAARKNMVHRLNQVTVPSVSSVDMTFPSVTPDLSSVIPEFQPEPHLYTMTVLEPGNNKNKNKSRSSTSSSSSSSEAKSRRRRPRDTSDTKLDTGLGFGLSGHVEPTNDFNNSSFSNDNVDDDDESADINKDSVDYNKSIVDYNYNDDNENEDENVNDFDDNEFVTDSGDVDIEKTTKETIFSYSSNSVQSTENKEDAKSEQDGSYETFYNPTHIKTEVDSIVAHDSSQNLIDNHETAAQSPPLPLRLSSELSSDDQQASSSNSDNGDKGDSEDRDESNGYLYILIGVFVAMDVVLWLYRISWLSNQLYAAKNGYADRIPTDDACKQVLEIQTAYHLPAFNGSMENTGTYVDGKEQLYGTEKERDNITFLQPLPNTKSDDILQQIWNEKTIQSEDRWAQRFFLIRWFEKFKEIMQRFFLSQLVWQTCVTFLAIIFISIALYAVEFWLVPENLRTLVGSQSATSDIQWQLDTSGRYLHALARQLTQQLARIRQLCDMEVAVLTEAFFSTINTQTSAFTVSLQRLCLESKGKNCEQLSVYKPAGGRIVGCNFLPLQAQTLHDLSLSNIEELVSGEVTPFLHLSKEVISTSSLFIVSMLCLRLICQVVATTVRHYLLLTERLPRVKVYQSEEPSQMLRGGVPGGSSNAMQRSQSWVDSCESGVYVGEGEDAATAALNGANKDEHGAKIISLNS